MRGKAAGFPFSIDIGGQGLGARCDFVVSDSR
jgi:hypothetical protein